MITELFEATKKGDLKKIQELLEQAQANDPKKFMDEINTSKNDTGNTILHLAVEIGNLEILKTLTNLPGINLNVRNARNENALMFSVKKGNLEGVRHFLSLSGLNLTDKNRAFLIAGFLGNLDIVNEFYQDKEIDLNERISVKDPPLIEATLQGHLSAVKSLLNRNDVDVNQTTRDGYSALMLATEKNYLNIVEALVKDPRTDKTIKNNDNKTAKDIAEERNLSQAFKLLGGEPLSQDVILNKCKKYLEVQANRRKEVYTQASLDEVISKMMPGQCSGLSGLWLYKQSQGLEEQFFGFIKLIADWDETAESLDAGKTKKEAGFMESVFEGMINDMRMLQIANRDPLMRYVRHQQDLPDVFEMMKESKLGPTVAREFSLSFILRQDELTEVLTNVMNEGKMVKIDGPNHAMAAMYKKPKFIAYDPNSVIGEKTFDTLDALQAYIEKSVITTLGFKNDKMPLTIAVFDRNNRKPHPYKETGAEMVQRFITMNDDVNRRQSGNFSSLSFATERDDTGVARTLLSTPGIQVNIPNNNGASPLLLATMNRNFEIVSDLLKHPEVNLSYVSNSGDNAIIFAFQGGYLDIADKLLNAVPPTEVSHQNNGGYTAFIASLSHKHYDASKLLLNYHKDKKGDIGLNKKTKDGWAALHFMAYSGNTEIIHQMLQLEDLDVNIKTNDNFTPLMIAVMHGHIEVVKLLATSKNIDFMAKDNNLQNALMMAIVYKKIDCIDFLLKTFKFNLSDKDKNGNTVLDLAIKTQDRHIIQKIAGHPDISLKDVLTSMKFAQIRGQSEVVAGLASAKNLNLNSPWVKNWLGIENLKNTALDLTSSENVTAILKDFGITVNTQNKSGLDILVTIAAEGYLDIVIGILSAVNVNTQDVDGYTPLMRAIANDRMNLVFLLVNSKNIDFSLKNKMDQNALALAISLGKENMVNELLSGNQFDLRERDTRGNTIFDLAIASGSPGIITNIARSASRSDCWHQMIMASSRGETSVIELLAKEKKINLKDPWVEFILAVTRNDIEAVKALLTYTKPDLNQKNNKGNTALMIAAKYNNIELAQLLLDAGADANIKNTNGFTAQDIANKFHNKEIVDLIQKASIKPQDSTPVGPAITLGYKSVGKIPSSTETPEPLSKKQEGPKSSSP